MKIEAVVEYKISSNIRSHINQLLQQSFPDYPLERSYYKQLPQFRYLVWLGESLIAHVGIEHRVITNGNVPVRIFGLIDLCVDPQYRSQGIATTLLQQIEKLGKASSIDFLVLFADNHRLYTTNGYQRVGNVCRWLMIDEHQILGIAERSLADCMMVKQIAERIWRDGIVDLLGYLF